MSLLPKLNQVKILSVAAHDEIREVMDRLVNKHANWSGEAARGIDEAEAYLVEEEFDVILCGAGIKPEDEKRLRDFCEKQLTFSPRVVRHYGGGSGLLYTEVMLAVAA